MTNFIPLFPLSIVAFPGENLNLHIFEERYKQLITECFADDKPFGILPVINNQLMDYGTTVQVVEVFEIHADGKMDIRTQGQQVFKVLEFVKALPDKLYSGAIVHYPPHQANGKAALMQQLIADVKELHRLLMIVKDFKKTDEELTLYDMAHHVGLQLQEEYELLQLPRHDQQQLFLKNHLTKVLPILQGMEQLKEKVKLNGHFRDLKGLDL